MALPGGLRMTPTKMSPGAAQGSRAWGGGSGGRAGKHGRDAKKRSGAVDAEVLRAMTGLTLEDDGDVPPDDDDVTEDEELDQLLNPDGPRSCPSNRRLVQIVMTDDDHALARIPEEHLAALGAGTSMVVLNTPGHDLGTAYLVQLATVRGSLRILQWLHDHGVLDVSLKGVEGYTALHRIAGQNINGIGNSVFKERRAVEVARLLLKAGADANARTDNGFAPLHCCLYSHTPNAEMLQVLVEMGGADVNARDPQGIVPALLAVVVPCKGKDSATHVLTDSSLDSVCYLLSPSAAKGRWDIVKYLVDMGADVSLCVTGCGVTLLDLALAAGDGEMERVVRAKGGTLGSPLSRAVLLSRMIAQGWRNLVKRLVMDYGVDPEAVMDIRGREVSMVEYARMFADEDVAKFLETRIRIKRRASKRQHGGAQQQAPTPAVPSGCESPTGHTTFIPPQPLDIAVHSLDEAVHGPPSAEPVPLSPGGRFADDGGGGGGGSVVYEPVDFDFTKGRDGEGGQEEEEEEEDEVQKRKQRNQKRRAKLKKKKKQGGHREEGADGGASVAVVAGGAAVNAEEEEGAEAVEMQAPKPSTEDDGPMGGGGQPPERAICAMEVDGQSPTHEHQHVQALQAPRADVSPQPQPSPLLPDHPPSEDTTGSHSVAQPPSQPPAQPAPDTPNVAPQQTAADEVGGQEEEEDEEGWLLDGAPDHLICPMSMVLMTDPVLAPDGRTYQRQALQQYIDYAAQNNKPLRSPITGLEIAPMYFENVILRSLVIEYIEAKTRDKKKNAVISKAGASGGTDGGGGGGVAGGGSGSHSGGDSHGLAV